MAFMQIISVLLLVFLGTTFIGASAGCYNKGQYGGFGLGVMLSFMVMIFTLKIVMGLIGG